MDIVRNSRILSGLCTRALIPGLAPGRLLITAMLIRNALARRSTRGVGQVQHMADMELPEPAPKAVLPGREHLPPPAVGIRPLAPPRRPTLPIKLEGAGLPFPLPGGLKHDSALVGVVAKSWGGKGTPHHPVLVPMVSKTMWLGCRDSNPNFLIQSSGFYRS